MNKRLIRPITVVLGALESRAAVMSFTFPKGSLLTDVRTERNQTDSPTVYIPNGYIRCHIATCNTEAELNVAVEDTEDFVM